MYQGQAFTREPFQPTSHTMINDENVLVMGMIYSSYEEKLRGWLLA
jgi:hypothetical protein